LGGIAQGRALGEGDARQLMDCGHILYARRRAVVRQDGDAAYSALGPVLDQPQRSSSRPVSTLSGRPQRESVRAGNNSDISVIAGRINRSGNRRTLPSAEGIVDFSAQSPTISHIV
jgi:hypothetical protein